MGLKDATVRIRRLAQVGSGAFVEKDLIVTAGHVLDAGGRDPVCSEFSIVHPVSGHKWSAIAIWIDPRWRNESDPAGDIGLIRVRPSTTTTVLVCGAFTGGVVTRFGYPASPHDPLGASATGSVTLTASLLYATDPNMQIPGGASGGPLVESQGQLVGVGTGLGVSCRRALQSEEI